MVLLAKLFLFSNDLCMTVFVCFQAVEFRANGLEPFQKQLNELEVGTMGEITHTLAYHTVTLSHDDPVTQSHHHDVSLDTDLHENGLHGNHVEILMSCCCHMADAPGALMVQIRRLVHQPCGGDHCL